MKRVKIMLAAVAVLAIVGGTLAFKTSKAAYCLYQIQGTTCPSVDFILTATTNGTEVENATFIENNGECPTTVATTLCDEILDTVKD